jgi:hypothetical protein
MRNPGTVLASRRKGVVVWQARISDDRGRLEVVGIVPASTMATAIEPLDERELRQLLGERTELHDGHDDLPLAPSLSKSTSDDAGVSDAG